MPALPNYNSTNNINANTAGPLRNEAAQPFKDDQKVITALQDSAQKWSDANDVMEYTKFKTETGIAIANQEAAAKADPDQNNVQAHITALDDIKKRSSKTINNQQVSERAYLELEHNLAIAKIKVDESFKYKKMLSNAMNLEKLVRTQSEKKATAATYALGQSTDLETMQIIQQNVATGTITEAHGRKLLDDYRLGSVDLDIMNDAATEKSQSYVYSQLKAGKDGIYSDLSDAERAERLEKTELHIRRNKIMDGYATQQNQDQNEKALLENFGSDSVTEGQVKDMLVSTKISPSFGNKYIKSMLAVPPQETDKETYNNIKMLQLEGKKNINNKVLDSVDKLTNEDRDSILKSSYDPLDQKTINIRASAQALHDWASQNEDSIVLKGNVSNEVVFNFLKRVEATPNANIDDIAQGVQKDYIKKTYPRTTLLPDVPNIIASKNRIKSIYQKESKVGGKPITKKPISSAYSTTKIDFDDL